MQSAKRKKLEAKGWKVASSADFLGLSPEEAAYVDLKYSLCKRLKELRIQKRLSQQDLAGRIKSSQSRIAKMEAGDASVSIDLVIRSLISLGASRKDLAGAIAASG